MSAGNRHYIPFPTPTHQAGFTLVEALVTGTIASIVISGIVVLFSFVGNRLESVGIEQQLAQESDFIISVISRAVRNGSSVSITGSQISIGIPPSTTRTFRVESSSKRLQNDEGGTFNPVPTPYQCEIDSFDVSPLYTNKGVRFSFVLSKTSGSTTIQFPRVTASALCKQKTSL